MRYPLCPKCGGLPDDDLRDPWFEELRRLVHALPQSNQDRPSRWVNHTIRDSVDCPVGEDLWCDHMYMTPAEAIEAMIQDDETDKESG